MCFSPQADLVGGVVITAIGIDAVRHVRQRRELIALAWLPLLLGATSSSRLWSGCGSRAMCRAGPAVSRCGPTC